MERFLVSAVWSHFFEKEVRLCPREGKYGEDGSETLDEYKAKIAKDPS